MNRPPAVPPNRPPGHAPYGAWAFALIIVSSSAACGGSRGQPGATTPDNAEERLLGASYDAVETAFTDDASVAQVAFAASAAILPGVTTRLAFLTDTESVRDVAAGLVCLDAEAREMSALWLIAGGSEERGRVEQESVRFDERWQPARVWAQPVGSWAVAEWFGPAPVLGDHCSGSAARSSLYTRASEDGANVHYRGTYHLPPAAEPPATCSEFDGRESQGAGLMELTRTVRSGCTMVHAELPDSSVRISESCADARVLTAWERWNGAHASRSATLVSPSMLHVVEAGADGSLRVNVLSADDFEGGRRAVVTHLDSLEDIDVAANGRATHQGAVFTEAQHGAWSDAIDAFDAGRVDERPHIVVIRADDCVARLTSVRVERSHEE